MTRAEARRRLGQRLEETRPALLDMARRLVAAPSANPPGDTRAAAGVAKDLLAAVPGIELREIEPQAGFVNIAARIAGARPGRRLVFNGHLDTFPIGDAGRWRHDPLGGAVENGRLYGRGIADMKGGIAASILALRLLAERREALAGEVAITLAADEETMGPLGTKHMLDHVPFARGDAMICGDAGSPRVLRFGEKGLLWIEIEAVGRPAHGAHVHLGDNAIDRLRAALDRLSDLRDLPVRAPPAVAAAIRRSRKVSEPLSGKGEAETLGRVTVNIGTIAGGISPNLIPATAKAAADIRLPVGMTLVRIEREIAGRLARLPGISYRILRRFEPSWTAPDHEIMRLCAANAKAATGKPPAINMRVGASDSRWYRACGIPTVVYGLAPHNMGGPDEYVTLDDLYAVAAVHALTAFDFLEPR
jgi:acetylornithine deacetylase/succinyl-diaminopimelate desuccinylase-like protein